MLARQIAHLTILWLVLIAWHEISHSVRIDVFADRGAAAVGRDWVLVDVVLCPL